MEFLPDDTKNKLPTPTLPKDQVKRNSIQLEAELNLKHTAGP